MHMISETVVEVLEFPALLDKDMKIDVEENS